LRAHEAAFKLYRGRRSYTPMVGHIAEAGQIMSGALEAFCLVVHKGAVDRPREGWSDWEIVWWYR